MDVVYIIYETCISRLMMSLLTIGSEPLMDAANYKYSSTALLSTAHSIAYSIA